jgi:hypothetical protein
MLYAPAAMRFVKLALAGAACALLCCACGIQAKPLAGTPHIDRAPGNHAHLDDPRVVHARCLRQHGLEVHEYRTRNGRLPAIQVGSLPTGPTIVFEPTPGIAQGLQIEGKAQAAEVIGAALLYPNGADNRLATIAENCTAIGVTG